MFTIVRYVAAFYLLLGLGVLILMRLPARARHLGPREDMGIALATEDIVFQGPEFAYAFAEATADFDEYFLDGYRKALAL